MSTDKSAFPFKNAPSEPVLAEIATLEGDGYFVHREWANGIELRKKSKVGYLGTLARCLLSIVAPVIFIPFFGRTILDSIFGFKYRVFVSRDPSSPRVRLC
ncbi:MAG: hypothetical protein V4484_17820 [Pseudomonadota bacterium]